MIHYIQEIVQKQTGVKRKETILILLNFPACESYAT